MRQDFFSFEPTHLLLLATNHLPRIDDDTEAVWRRIRVIPFTVQIPEEDRDEHLGDKLRAEADAVLTWIVDGWKHYRQRGGLDAPDAVKVATGDYKAESDAVGRFITEDCFTGSAQLYSSRTKPLYQRWEQWARTDGCPQMSQIAFGRALDNKGYPAEKGTREGFRRGIALKPEPHEGVIHGTPASKPQFNAVFCGHFRHLTFDPIRAPRRKVIGKCLKCLQNHRQQTKGEARTDDYRAHCRPARPAATARRSQSPARAHPTSSTARRRGATGSPSHGNSARWASVTSPTQTRLNTSWKSWTGFCPSGSTCCR
jgi:hypothetical protein